MSTSRCRRSAARRRTSAGWRSNWPRRPTSSPLANVALDGLFEGTQVDAGAVLLLARATSAEAARRRPRSRRLAQRFAASLSSRLAVPGGDGAARRRSRAGPQRDGRQPARQPRQQGEILATSVICAPIRRDGKVARRRSISTRPTPSKSTDPDDLEFTLAVADTVAVALENLSRRQELAENLNQIRDENVQLRERLGVQSEIVGTSEAMTQVAQRNRPRRAEPRDGADPRRERRRQGTRRPRRALLQPATQGAVRLPQLRGAVRDAARKRTVRPREGRVHRRDRAQDRQVRSGRTRARSCSTKSAR